MIKGQLQHHQLDELEKLLKVWIPYVLGSTPTHP
jgi:hypothetical protein